MLLLDRIVEYDLEKPRLVSEVDVGERDLFYRKELGGVPAYVGFEYMAQSIAALSGVNTREHGGGEPKIGFIMSIRAFATDIPSYPAGKTVRVSVSEVFRESSVVSFDCVVSLDGAVVTKAVVNAIEVDSVSEFLSKGEQA
jgi:predicted hotdog family 3-hydroxylacyl-ACP dehydratase